MVTWQLSRKPLKNYLHITTFSKLTVYIGEIVASKLLSTLLCQSIFRLCRLTTFQYLPSFLVTLDNTHNTLPLMPLFTLLLMHDLAWQYQPNCEWWADLPVSPSHRALTTALSLISRRRISQVVNSLEFTHRVGPGPTTRQPSFTYYLSFIPVIKLSDLFLLRYICTYTKE